MLWSEMVTELEKTPGLVYAMAELKDRDPDLYRERLQSSPFTETFMSAVIKERVHVQSATISAKENFEGAKFAD